MNDTRYLYQGAIQRLRQQGYWELADIRVMLVDGYRMSRDQKFDDIVSHFDPRMLYLRNTTFDITTGEVNFRASSPLLWWSKEDIYSKPPKVWWLRRFLFGQEEPKLLASGVKVAATGAVVYDHADRVPLFFIPFGAKYTADGGGCFTLQLADPLLRMPA